MQQCIAFIFQKDDALLTCDQLLEYFEREASLIDSQFLSDSKVIHGYGDFQSAITMNGQPILPPLVNMHNYYFQPGRYI